MRPKQTVIFVSTLIIPLISFDVVGQTTASVSEGKELEMQGSPCRLFTRAFSSKMLNAQPIPVVVLHGDAPPPYEHPNYQYIFLLQKWR